MLEGLADGLEAQEDAFYWLARAASRTSKSFTAVRDMLNLVKAPGNPMPDHFAGFDGETKLWFEENFHDLNVLSVRSMKRKMARLFKDDRFVRMFNADGFAVALTELQPGAVVLVDTSRRVLGDEGSAVLGRLFIKLLDELSDWRTKPGATLWPIHVYIDEASSYVAHDRSFIELLDRARDQEIAVTTSNQADDTSQVSANVQAALKRCNLQTRCIRFEQPPGEFQLSAYSRSAVAFHTNFLFKDAKMSESEYETMRRRMTGKPHEKKDDKHKRDDRRIL